MALASGLAPDDPRQGDLNTSKHVTPLLHSADPDSTGLPTPDPLRAGSGEPRRTEHRSHVGRHAAPDGVGSQWLINTLTDPPPPEISVTSTLDLSKPEPSVRHVESEVPTSARVAPSSSTQTASSVPVAPTVPQAPTAPPNAIEINGLNKKFKDMVAVESVSFVVPTGSIVALLGPNGAGKTTVVNMLCTLLVPDGGSATVAGHSVLDDPAAVRRSIMLTGQFAALDESLTGKENLVLFGRLLGLSKSEAQQRATDLLDQFDLSAAANRMVREYSGGMRRRIDIACGLVTMPKVVFLDEPTTGLDPRSRQEVWRLVDGLRQRGVTTLLTTQYLEEADALSDSIVVIDHGQVIAEGTADQLKEQTGSSYCEVTPAHMDELPRLRALLGDLIGDADDRPVPESDETPQNTYSLSVPARNGAETLVEVVRRTDDAGIRLSDVALRRPTLDEVFLALTDPEQRTVAR
ncbi:ATP-binding cassette domain-containing protein [Gordonia sp. CPCC 205515]|uniref:ATP-binding cassette domain-containing protein n=1 Tax=Gordonia sp. CPCC 205515 TaxID=3140791 RepID=UPI003AF35871